MKNQTKLSSLAKIVGIILCLIGFVGCKPNLTLNTSSTPGEVQTGAPVTVDGKTAGYVRTVSPRGEVEFAITNKLNAQTLRRGTVHVRERGKIALDTSAADVAGPLLRNGDVVPTQSKAAHFARQWARSAGLLIGLAVIVLAICVAKLLLFKIAGPLVPFIAALLLAGFTAWILSPPLTPVIDRCYVKFAPQADSSATTQSADAGAGTLARWQSRMVGSLGTRPDPHLISFVLIGVVALPLWLWFICRMRSICHASCTIVPAILLASVATVSAESSGTSFSRDFLVQEQAKALRFIADSEQACGKANRLAQAGLVSEASEELLRGNFYLDVAEITLCGQPDRLKNLKASAFRYIASEERRRLTTEFELLTERVKVCQIQASTLHQRVTTLNEREATILQIYLAQQDRYRQRISDGLTDPRLVLAEARAVVRFGLPLVRAGLVTSENASQCRLNDDATVTLPNGLIVARDGKAVTAPAIVMTNTVRLTNTLTVTNIVEKVVTSPPLTVVKTRFVTNTVVVVTNPPLTLSPEIRYVTNTVPSAKRAASAALAVLPTNSPANVPTDQGQLPLAPKTVADENPGKSALVTTAKRPSNVALIAGVLGGGIVLCAIAWLAYMSSLRGRPHLLSLSCDSGKPQEIEIAAMEEALCLQIPPVRETATLVNGTPNIIINWRGPVLRPGSHSVVRIKGKDVCKNQKIFPGDLILIEGEKPQQFEFLGCDPVDAGLTAEA